MWRCIVCMYVESGKSFWAEGIDKVQFVFATSWKSFCTSQKQFKGGDKAKTLLRWMTKGMLFLKWQRASAAAWYKLTSDREEMCRGDVSGAQMYVGVSYFACNETNWFIIHLATEHLSNTNQKYWNKNLHYEQDGKKFPACLCGYQTNLGSETYITTHWQLVWLAHCTCTFWIRWTMTTKSSKVVSKTRYQQTRSFSKRPGTTNHHVHVLSLMKICATASGPTCH